jgi:Uma2 family endonuclease
MLSVLEDPAIRERVPALTVEHYHRLYEVEIAPNVELIRGALIEKMPQSPLHSSIVVLLGRHLQAHIPAEWHLRSEQPLTLSDSEPEPDLAIVSGLESAYFQKHPGTAALIIEVCISTEHLDRVKLGLYAEAGVQECWLILAEERAVERHTDPQGAAYQTVKRIAWPANLPSVVFPDLVLPPANIFPSPDAAS